MELMSKLKEIIPWKRKPVETHQVLSLRDDINRLFDRILMAPFEYDWDRPSRFSSADVGETEQGIQVRIDVPGLDPEYLHVTTRHGTLHVHYEREEDSSSNGSATAYRYAAFDRSIALPEGIDTARAEAVCKHGVLTVSFPWKEAQESRRILISDR
ncbi:MAG TPA: Hsp20/alpha crystallin family protein [Nitrospiraceae bacterium]|nr:Hsp20/alpha crystallin family protein [Nitrospiraceae bacterium]